MESTANQRTARLEQRLALPVVLAALVSVPSMLLTMWGTGHLATIGTTGNWVSGTVLWVEWILLIVLAEDKLSWLREHKWTVTIAVLTVPAIILAIGPIQVLRLVLMLSGLRILRVTRIMEAGSVLQRRLRLNLLWRRVTLALVALVTIGFAAVMLADPDSQIRRLLTNALERWGPVPLAAGGAALLIGAGLIVAYYRNRSG